MGWPKLFKDLLSKRKSDLERWTDDRERDWPIEVDEARNAWHTTHDKCASTCPGRQKVLTQEVTERRGQERGFSSIRRIFSPGWARGGSQRVSCNTRYSRNERIRGYLFLLLDKHPRNKVIIVSCSYINGLEFTRPDEIDENPLMFSKLPSNLC
ncbi:hypothetical protein KPH14_005352 [Odynerus spinipes]|uniref:Uncharacterized protein n=1 Tax=Odynerus spinipes TaxID=1348599 RepID=A0AAD9VJ65_9HYME|nr:hypothetical protein KPH14_005352 [Odynerus spinipes]